MLCDYRRMDETHTDSRWERRWHPLLSQWVLIAAHRQDRPWAGERVEDVTGARAAYDPSCYLCPGNTRIGGERNPDFRDVHAFDNDRPSLSTGAPATLAPATAPYRRASAFGCTRVLCYTPRHDLPMSRLPLSSVECVVDAWCREHRQLAAIPGVTSVLVFENRGEVTGMSNPHAHGQIYASGFRYDVVERHLAAARQHREDKGGVLYAALLEAEQKDAKRIVAAREHAIAFVPWFARFAYEVHVAPRRSVPHVTELRDAEASDLAAVLHEVLVRYDNLWQCNFPYLLTLQQAPVDGGQYEDFHFHIQLHPPLRKPGLKKYLAAHEVGGGNFLADTVPEESAAELRAVPPTHWRDRP